MEQDRSNRRKWLLTTAKLLVVGFLVWFVHQTLVDALGSWSEVLKKTGGQLQLHPEWLVISGAVYLLGLLPAGLFWRHVLRSLGQDVHFGETLRAYFIGHLGKYVPGKAMVVVLRTGFIRSHRVDTAVAAVSVFYETLTMMAVGAFIAAAILATWFQEQTFLFWTALGLMAVAGVPTWPPLFRRLVRLARVGKSDPSIRQKIEKLGYRTLLLGWASMTVCWCLLGLSLWAVLQAMGVANLDLIGQLPLYIASVALAMVAGFLSLIPGGAAVRELVLTELVSPHFGAGIALASAILLRLVWLVSELIISGILYGVGRWRIGRHTSDAAVTTADVEDPDE